MKAPSFGWCCHFGKIFNVTVCFFGKIRLLFVAQRFFFLKKKLNFERWKGFLPIFLKQKKNKDMYVNNILYLGLIIVTCALSKSLPACTCQVEKKTIDTSDGNIIQINYLTNDLNSSTSNCSITLSEEKMNVKIIRIELTFNVSFLDCIFVDYLFLDNTTHDDELDMTINRLQLNNVYANLSSRYKVPVVREWQSYMTTGLTIVYICNNALFVISSSVAKLDLNNFVFENIDQSLSVIATNTSMFLNTPLFSMNPATNAFGDELPLSEVYMKSAYIYNCSLQNWLTGVVGSGATFLYVNPTSFYLIDSIFAYNINMDTFTTIKSVLHTSFLQNAFSSSAFAFSHDDFWYAAMHFAHCKFYENRMAAVTHKYNRINHMDIAMA
ncbi:hypothetical protein RFI_19239 [Reticulomyxa filosa]|uniref:Uncharacterized protein n=1 Tax=Reticulomyxa filosa TaxID=46433 RepID=X6MVN3_RETFI|nr:hypothetical protein RFI_19239 [Reticulomyxa filosa]|eukprot:ETO18058.1 hypothetical protein RFI_19239 [Reticulomyxa filosa]